MTDAEYPTLKERYKKHANRPNKRHRRNGVLFGELLENDNYDCDGFGSNMEPTNSVASDTADLNEKMNKGVSAKDYRFNGVLELPSRLNYVDVVRSILEKPESTTSGLVQHLVSGRKGSSEYDYCLLTSLVAMAQLTLMVAGETLLEECRRLEMARSHITPQEYNHLLAGQRQRMAQLSNLQVSRADVERRGSGANRIEPGDRIVTPTKLETDDVMEESMVEETMVHQTDDEEVIEFSAEDDPYL